MPRRAEAQEAHQKSIRVRGPLRPLKCTLGLWRPVSGRFSGVLHDHLAKHELTKTEARSAKPDLLLLVQANVTRPFTGALKR